MLYFSVFIHPVNFSRHWLLRLRLTDHSTLTKNMCVLCQTLQWALNFYSTHFFSLTPSLHTTACNNEHAGRAATTLCFLGGRAKVEDIGSCAKMTKSRSKFLVCSWRKFFISRMSSVVTLLHRGLKYKYFYVLMATNQKTLLFIGIYYMEVRYKQV